MSHVGKQLEEHSPDLEWAETHFRPYLLDALDDGDAERLCDLLFLHPHLSDQLTLVESELLDEFLDRKLEIGPGNSGLIARWSSEAGRAAIELAKLKRSLAAPSAKPAPRSTNVVVLRDLRPLLRYASIAAAAILALLTGYLALDRSNRGTELAEANRKLQQVAETNQELARRNSELARDLQAANRDRSKSNPKVPSKSEGAQLAGSTQTLPNTLANATLRIDPQQSLYWNADTVDANDFEVLVRTLDGREHRRSLKVTRGRLEIPFDSGEVPFSFSIRNKRTGITPIANVSILGIERQ